MANIMPGEWDWQIQDAERKRKFADLLRQQAQPQGQMVGNTYVAPSWTQRLAAVVSNIQGQRMANDADQTEKQAYDAQRQKYQVAAQKLAQALRGTPAVEGNNTDNADFQNNPGAFIPARPASTDDILGAQVQYASDIGDPNALNNAVSSTIGYRIKQQDREDDQAFRTKTLEAEQKFRADQAQAEREARMAQLREQIAAREQAGRDSADLRRELAEQQRQTQIAIAGMRNQGGQPYFQAIPTTNGVYSFNARTGAMAPVTVNGQTVTKTADDPALQGQIAGAKEAGKVTSGAAAQAKVDLPNNIAQAQNTIGLVDDLLKHPGLSTAVGTSSKLDPRNYIPGTDATDFKIRLDQIKGQQFLQAYNTLRGGGQITEVEGKKATDAISRMNTASSETEFRKAAKEFQDIIRAGVDRAKQKAGVPVTKTISVDY